MEQVTLAQARACYAALAQQLASLRWKRHLRQHPRWLREALALEASLPAALAPEGPASHPLRRLRTRLERLARRRLVRFTRQGADSLGEVLGRLEALVHAPRPLPPDASEPVLLHGHQGWRHFLAWPGSWVFLLLALSNRVGLERLGRPGPLLFIGGALCLYFHLRCSGRFWLTARRLLWQPRFGEPVQVSLDSLSSEAISALPVWGEVRVHGERSLCVRHAGHAGRLAALLELHLRPPFRGAVEGTPRVEEVAVLPARARGEPGTAVLRPGYAAFLPAHRQVEVFRSLAGPDVRGPEADVSVELLVEQLRLLPESEFDAHLRRAVLASGGVLWRSGELPTVELRPSSAPGASVEHLVRQWAA